MPRPFVQIIVFVSLCFPFFLLWNNSADAFSGDVPAFVQDLEGGDLFSEAEETEPFAGYKSVTRGDFLRWAIDIYGIDTSLGNEASHPFVDIDAFNPLSQYVSYGYATGALRMFEQDGKFLPQRKLSRVQGVEMFFALYTGGAFQDYDVRLAEEIQDLPQDARQRKIMLYAVSQGYISAENGFIFPHKNLTREEALYMVYRYIEGYYEALEEDTLPASSGSGTLSQVQNLVEQEYWHGGEIGDHQLEEAAISGMVDSLDDPYSVYLPPEESDAFNEYFNEDAATDENIEYAGLGVSVQEANDGGLVITQVFAGSPAEKENFLVGDIIIAVEGVNMQGATVQQIVEQILGPVGTTATLTITRNGSVMTKSFVREKIFVEDLSSVTVETVDDIVWIKVRAFKSFTSRDFTLALQENVTETTKGVIVDLRYNPGGIMDAAQRMLGEILPDGSIAVRLYSNAGEEVFRVNGSGDYTQIPLVVFQNEYSASASEIFSAAVQDYERGDIIGTQSYGKGIAQSVYHLSRGSLKLTTAEFRSPLQNVIHGVGITPDTVMNAEDDASYLYEAKKVFR